MYTLFTTLLVIETATRSTSLFVKETSSTGRPTTWSKTWSRTSYSTGTQVSSGLPLESQFRVRVHSDRLTTNSRIPGVGTSVLPSPLLLSPYRSSISMYTYKIEVIQCTYFPFSFHRICKNSSISTILCFYQLTRCLHLPSPNPGHFRG